ncbi:MAG: hypothetical protein ACOYYJ_13445 [Chloroflexota bacterium]
MPRHFLTLLLAAALLAACAPAAPAPTARTSEVFAQHPEGAETSEVSTLTATPTPTPEPGLEDAPPGSYKDDETDDVYAQDGQLIYTKVGSEWVKVIEQPVYPDLRNEELVDIQVIGEDMFSVEALNGRLAELGAQVNAQGKIVDETGNVISEDLIVNTDGTVNFTWRYTDEAGKQVADMDVFHAGNIRVVGGQLYVAGYRWDGATGSWRAEQNAFPLENPEAQVGVFYLGDIANGNWARFMGRALETKANTPYVNPATGEAFFVHPVTGEKIEGSVLDALFAGALMPGRYSILEAQPKSDFDINHDGIIDNKDTYHRGVLAGLDYGDQKGNGARSFEGRTLMDFVHFCPDGGTIIVPFVYRNADGSYTTAPMHLDLKTWADKFHRPIMFSWFEQMMQSDIHVNENNGMLLPVFLYSDSAVDYGGYTAPLDIMPDLEVILPIIEGRQDGVLDPAVSLVNWGGEILNIEY